LIFLISSTCFGDVFAEPQEHFNPLNAKLNSICHLLALLGAHPILHVSRIRVNYIKLWYNAPTGDTVPSQPYHRSAAVSVHFTKAVYTVKLLLRMGENIAGNMWS
jgi:hypothetical protein